jgi:ABC-type phosphate transport system substrate-binding protein
VGKVVVCLFCCFIVIWPLAVRAQEPKVVLQDIVIIVNKANPVNDLTAGELAQIFRGVNCLWSNGKRIIVVNQALGTKPRELFYRKILKEPPSAKFYIAGTMAPISTVVQKSDDAVKLFISNMVNAIGYIRVEAVDDHVKVLKIK